MNSFGFILIKLYLKHQISTTVTATACELLNESSDALL